MSEDHVPRSAESDDVPAAPPAGRPSDGNQLAAETSPYLRQHAANPVHWRAWNQASIDLARELDRPIFLSVGYATCYWCHVMERESFESVAIAELLNTLFVPIKVDREERPDVDHLYMQSVQLLNHGQGGWPMSVFIEPGQLRPFLAGTYYPPEDGLGRPGFASVLRQVHGFWTGARDRVELQAERLAEEIRHLVAERPPVRPLTAETVTRAVDQLMDAHDPVHGGFGGGAGRPKFPTPVNLDLLMTAGWDRADVRRAVVLSLDRMALGGIHDHVGGGFHRYSVDERWEIPHFEKMLYDNAQLLSLYARGFGRTRDPFHRRAAEGIIDWARREMRLDGGAFASALDAEVDHREGLNYLWTPDDVALAMAAAGRAEETPRVLSLYGLDRGPNFQDPHHPEEPVRSVLLLPDRPEGVAAALGMGEDDFEAWRRGIDEILLTARSRRAAPLRDDKVLAGWNGLMIAGLAEAGRLLELPGAVDDAARAARFVLQHLRTPDGALARSWRGEASPVPAALEDHAMLAGGLLALHAATGEQAWCDDARRLLDDAAARFRDADGGWWDCEADRPDLFVRVRDLHDGATPSGTSAVLGALVALGEATGDDSRFAGAAAGCRAISAELATRPGGSPAITRVLHRLLAEHADVATALAGTGTPPGTEDGAGRGTGAGVGTRVVVDGGAAAGDERAPGGAPRGPDGDDPAPSTAAADAPDADITDADVTVTSSPAEVRLSADRVARATLVLTIAPGLHVHAHDPGMDGLAGLDVELLDGDGVELEIAHPPGRPHHGPLGETRVHTDSVAIPLHFRTVGPITGRPRLQVRVQPCSDSSCHAPRTVPVPMRFVVD